MQTRVQAGEKEVVACVRGLAGGGGGDREKDGGREGLLWRRGSSRGDGEEAN